jgi:uncharacterized protein YqeY
MALSDKINNDLKDAMKAREKVKLEALRNIKKVIIEAKAAKGAGSELADDEVLKIISKLAKQGTDSANIYREQGREDLYDQEIQQVKILESYLPEKLSKEVLTERLKLIISQLGASSMKDMGKVMGVASKELAGLADGKEISEIVRALLK